MSGLIGALIYGLLIGIANSISGYVKNVGYEDFNYEKAIPSILIGAFIAVS